MNKKMLFCASLTLSSTLLLSSDISLPITDKYFLSNEEKQQLKKIKEEKIKKEQERLKKIEQEKEKSMNDFDFSEKRKEFKAKEFTSQLYDYNLPENVLAEFDKFEELLDNGNINDIKNLSNKIFKDSQKGSTNLFYIALGNIAMGEYKKIIGQRKQAFSYHEKAYLILKRLSNNNHYLIDYYLASPYIVDTFILNNKMNLAKSYANISSNKMKRVFGKRSLKYYNSLMVLSKTYAANGSNASLFYKRMAEEILNHYSDRAVYKKLLKKYNSDSAFIYEKINRDNKAINISSKYINEAKKVKQEDRTDMFYIHLAEVHYIKGEALLSKNKYVESLKNLYLTKNIYEHIFKENVSINRKYIYLLRDISIAYRNKGDLKEAIKNIKRTISLLKDLSNKRGSKEISSLLNDLSDIYYDNNEKKKAVKILEEQVLPMQIKFLNINNKLIDITKENIYYIKEEIKNNMWNEDT